MAVSREDTIDCGIFMETGVGKQVAYFGGPEQIMSLIHNVCDLTDFAGAHHISYTLYPHGKITNIM